MQKPLLAFVLVVPAFVIPAILRNHPDSGSRGVVLVQGLSFLPFAETVGRLRTAEAETALELTQ